MTACNGGADLLGHVALTLFFNENFTEQFSYKHGAFVIYC